MYGLTGACLDRFNLELVRTRPRDMEAEFWAIHDRVRPATMTSTARMYALWSAIRHLERLGIKGDIIECGVWKGGSSMLAALTLLQAQDDSRSLWLYDTFQGMPAPSAHDGKRAQDLYSSGPTDTAFAFAPRSEVEANMASTTWPAQRLNIIEGMVEETIPDMVPDGPIALIRLDTDWYESTRHELRHLYPRLCPGGILILDDYGYWAGARRAVDEWLAALPDPPLLTRVDHTGRMAIKPSI